MDEKSNLRTIRKILLANKIYCRELSPKVIEILKKADSKELDCLSFMIELKAHNYDPQYILDCLKKLREL